MNRKLFIIAAIFCASGATLSGQGGSPASVNLRLIAFTPEFRNNEVYAQDPAADSNAASVPVKIKNSLNHEVAAVSLKTRKVVFTEKPDRASLTRDGEMIGEINLPARVNSAVLIFLPGKPGDKAKSQIMVVDDSGRAFPAGSYHVTNLSNLPVRLMLERKTYDFTPGKTVLIEDPPARENRMIGMRAFVFQDDKMIPVSTGLWPHPGRCRSVKVLFQDPVTGKIQLRSFDDVPSRVQSAMSPAAAQQS
jgi:hypothetical protein